MNETLKIFTLGSFSLQLGDAPVGKFISRKADALVVYLACNRYEHPREILAEMLWNDLPQERSLGNLRTVLSSLQQQLTPYLLITRQMIGFKPDSNIWMDIHETCMDEAESSRSILGTPLLPHEQQRHGEFIWRARSMIDEQLFMDAWETGCQMSLEEAITYSLDQTHFNSRSNIPLIS